VPEFNDEIWKRSIHTLFRPMVDFHFPELHPLIDWSREPAFLEEELANLFDPKKEGKRFVDILAQVFLLDGTEKYILLHVEVQGYGSGEEETREFEERMFEYYYRVRDKWKVKDIAALAILTDGNEKYRPDRYKTSFFGTTLTYVFNVSKIIDYNDDDLANNFNPFATLMLAAKRALKVERSDDETKKLFKIALLRLGIAKGYTAKELEALFYFVDWVVAFSGAKARNEFVGEVRAMAKKEEITMPYVTSIEEVTREETRIETMRAIAFKMLKAGESDDKILMYAEISPEELGKLKKNLRQETC